MYEFFGCNYCMLLTIKMVCRVEVSKTLKKKNLVCQHPDDILEEGIASNINVCPKRRHISNRQHDVANPEDGNRHRGSDITKEAWNFGGGSLRSDII